MCCYSVIYVTLLWHLLSLLSFIFLGMFDKDGNGTVSFDEFCALWKYITDWLNCFKSFDKDNSGTIDKNELKTAFTSFGMSLCSIFLLHI